MTISVTHLALEDRAQWEQMYRGYAAFYQVPMTDETLERVWSWIFNPQQPFYSLIAKDAQGAALGLMHFREMASPLRGALVGFLDDLFVEPAARGNGVVDALFAQLKAEADAKGWPLVRWITADDNYRGRAVYDRIAAKTKWLTYQMDV
ncbi:MAG: GNAT family N-acetyltransferase [Oceanospirillaceae bacterium]